MPAQAPPTTHAAATRLDALGARIRGHRKALRVSASAAAEAAGMSRVTLHRIEQGEPSVTMGAYMNALAVLGLSLDVLPPAAQVAAAQPGPVDADGLPARIRTQDHAQLKLLAWHVP